MAQAQRRRTEEAEKRQAKVAIGCNLSFLLGWCGGESQVWGSEYRAERGMLSE